VDVKGKPLLQKWAKPVVLAGDGKITGGEIGTLPADVVDGSVVKLQYTRKDDSVISDQGEVIVSSNSGWGIITDMDDTIKISGVLDPRSAFQHTFTKPFEPVPLMPDVFVKLSTLLATDTAKPLFVYLTQSPIFLLKHVQEFLGKFFPKGPILMAETTIDQLGALLKLKDVVAYKVGKGSKVVKDFSSKSWALFGDSGQMDPTVYATLYKDIVAAGNKACIYIRAVSGVDPAKEAVRNSPIRFATDFKDVPKENWVIFNDAKELMNIDPRKACYPPGKVNEVVDAAAKIEADVAKKAQEAEALAAARAEQSKGEWSSMLSLLTTPAPASSAASSSSPSS